LRAGPKGCTVASKVYKLEHLFNFIGEVAVVSWILLGMAVLTEVAATVSLKLSDGFTKLVPATVVVIGYAASFVLLSKILQRGMHIGVVYAVWSALGISLIVIVDALWFGNRLSALQVGGLLFVVAGIAALQLGGNTV
jgi:small multidrug resistance pump